MNTYYFPLYNGTEVDLNPSHRWNTRTVELKKDLATQAQPGDFYRFTRGGGGGQESDNLVKNFRAVALLHKE